MILVVGAAGKIAGRSIEVRNREPGQAIPEMPEVVPHFATAMDV